MSDTLKQDILKSARLSGRFLLRSGKTSETYFDKYQFESDPALLARIAKAMAPMIPEGTEVLAGLELGGVPVATALSLETGLPAVFVRKARKAYGTAKIAEGTSIEGRNVCIIEDIITTGGQALESAEYLIDDGAKILGICCVIERSETLSPGLADLGIKVVPLIRAKA